MRSRFLSGRWSESAGVVVARALVIGWVVWAVGCAGKPEALRGPIVAHDPRDVGGLEASEQMVGVTDGGMGVDSSGRRALGASIDGQAIDASELGEMLSEAAGEEVLAETALDAVLRARCKAAGIEITRSDVEAEEARLREAVSRAAGEGSTLPGERADGRATERLIDRVRTRRGLGPMRFSRLLERTAMLRRLSASEVASVDESELRRAYEVRYGERVRCRVMRGASASEVGAWVARARVGADVEVAFARVAMEHSMDPSASVGGLVAAFSTSDPAYPAALREAIEGLAVGGMTPVVSVGGVEGGYAAAMLVERLPGTGESFDQVRDSLVKELEQERERRAMEAYARRAMGEARVRAESPGLQWSWRRRVVREVVP